VSAELPEIDRARFAAELGALCPEPLPEGAVRALHAHYEELRRWARRLALIGPGTAGEALIRHYGESFAALPWLPPVGGTLVDVGSGAGFPGLVLAALRPTLQVTLVEARERKWAFLRAAAARAGLRCSCLRATVGPSVPQGVPESIDVLTVRAVRLAPPTLAALRLRMHETSRLLLWAGEALPALPEGLREVAAVALAGSRTRTLHVVVPEAA